MALRNSVVTLMLGISATLVLAACKGSDPAGSGGSGGSGGKPSMNAPVVYPPAKDGESCQDGSSSCNDKPAIDAYGACVLKTCDTQYKQCFGASYATGTFGGDCTPISRAVAACEWSKRVSRRRPRRRDRG